MSSDKIAYTDENQNEAENEDIKNETNNETDYLNETNNKEDVKETKALLKNNNSLEETKPKNKSKKKTKVDDIELKEKSPDYATDTEEEVRKLTKWQKRRKFVYDKQTHKLFGRTLRSWGLLFIYFISFYIVLVALFMAMMYGFLNSFIAVNQPYRTGAQSLLEFIPGLNVQPRITIESALIVGSVNESSDIHKLYTLSLNQFFKKSFREPHESREAINCTNSETLQNISQFCRFEKNLLGPCSNPEKELRLGRLCFFVRINKIFGWLPNIENKLLSNDTFVDCEGSNPGDQNNLGKPVYYPNSIFNNTASYGIISNKYFPFINQPNYSSPMVAVQFPHMTRNVAILVQCTMHNLQKTSKPVKFEIMLLSK